MSEREEIVEYTAETPLELLEMTLDELEKPSSPADRQDRLQEAEIELAGLRADFNALQSHPERCPDVDPAAFKERLTNAERRLESAKSAAPTRQPLFSTVTV